MPSRSVRPQRASHSTCRCPREVPRSLRRAGWGGQSCPGEEGRAVAPSARCCASCPATAHVGLCPGAGAAVSMARGSLWAEEGAPCPLTSLQPLVSGSRMSCTFPSPSRACAWPRRPPLCGQPSPASPAAAAVGVGTGCSPSLCAPTLQPCPPSCPTPCQLLPCTPIHVRTATRGRPPVP